MTVRPLATIAVLLAATVAAPVPPASADDVLAAIATYGAPMVSVRAEPGIANDISVNWLNVPGTPSLQVQDAVTSASQVIRIDASCGGDPGDYVFNATCVAGGEDPPVLIALGDGDDIGSSYNSNALGHRVSIFGAAGNDLLSGSASTDSLYGGPGDDRLTPDGGVLDVNGGDLVSGGPGVDTVVVHRYPEGSMVVTLDGVADDGETGENDNYGADVENVVGALDGPNLITGNGAVNTITGGRYDDTINVRDGVPDFVDCGGIGDRDTVVADATDLLTGCEVVLLPPPPPPVTGPGGPGAVGLTLASTKLGADRRRTTTVAKVRCPAGASRCRGRLVVKAGRATLASGAYSAAPGRTDRVTLRLSGKARRLLARKSRVPIVIVVKPKAGAAGSLAGLLTR